MMDLFDKEDNNQNVWSNIEYCNYWKMTIFYLPAAVRLLLVQSFGLCVVQAAVWFL